MTKMNWHFGNPNKSGLYTMIHRLDGSIQICSEIPYSAKWDQWNCYDWMKEEEVRDCWFEGVTAIAYVPFKEFKEAVLDSLVEEIKPNERS